MLRREDSRPALDFRTAAGQDDVRGIGVEVGPEAAAYDAPVAVREVAREVAAESLTDLPPSVGLPEGKVARHLGTMGRNTLPRKPPYLPTSRSDLRQNSAATNPVTKSPATVASTLRFTLHFSLSSAVNEWSVGNHDQRSASSPNFVRGSCRALPRPIPRVGPRPLSGRLSGNRPRSGSMLSANGWWR